MESKIPISKFIGLDFKLNVFRDEYEVTFISFSVFSFTAENSCRRDEESLFWVLSSEVRIAFFNVSSFSLPEFVNSCSEMEVENLKLRTQNQYGPS